MCACVCVCVCVCVTQATEERLAREQRTRTDCEAQLASERTQWADERSALQETLKRSEAQWQERVRGVLTHTHTHTIQAADYCHIPIRSVTSPHTHTHTHTQSTYWSSKGASHEGKDRIKAGLPYPCGSPPRVHMSACVCMCVYTVGKPGLRARGGARTGTRRRARSGGGCARRGGRVAPPARADHCTGR